MVSLVADGPIASATTFVATQGGAESHRGQQQRQNEVRHSRHGAHQSAYHRT